MKLIHPILTCLSLILVSCTNAAPSPTVAYLQVDTGEPCQPDMTTMGSAPLRGHNGQGNGKGGHNSPTGISGDNIDDPRSGKIDCYYDGNSGQGNDKGGCLIVTICDADGCCEDPNGPNVPNDGDPNVPNDGDPNVPNDSDPNVPNDSDPNSGLDDDGDGVDDDGDGKIDEDYGDGDSGDGSLGDGDSSNLDDDGDGIDDDGDGKIDENYVGDGSADDGDTVEPPVIR